MVCLCLCRCLECRCPHSRLVCLISGLRVYGREFAAPCLFVSHLSTMSRMGSGLRSMGLRSMGSCL